MTVCSHGNTAQFLKTTRMHLCARTPAGISTVLFKQTNCFFDVMLETKGELNSDCEKAMRERERSERTERGACNSLFILFSRISRISPVSEFTEVILVNNDALQKYTHKQRVKEGRGSGHKLRDLQILPSKKRLPN